MYVLSNPVVVEGTRPQGRGPWGRGQGRQDFTYALARIAATVVIFQLSFLVKRGRGAMPVMSKGKARGGGDRTLFSTLQADTSKVTVYECNDVDNHTTLPCRPIVSPCPYGRWFPAWQQPVRHPRMKSTNMARMEAKARPAQAYEQPSGEAAGRAGVTWQGRGQGCHQARPGELPWAISRLCTRALTSNSQRHCCRPQAGHLPELLGMGASSAKGNPPGC